MIKQTRSKMETDYTKIKVHILFEPIKKLFEFYILGIGFVGMPNFQRAFLSINPGMKPLIDDYNKEVNLQVNGSQIKASTKLYLDYTSRVMAIALFDVLQFSKYQNKLNRTEIFRFSKIIRNGAAHNNKFYFEKPLNKPVQWRDKIIKNEMAGESVIPNFMNSTLLIFLMSDISDLIETKTKKNLSSSIAG